ncbi:MAG TPA: DUF697 domain-containing protein [Actinomycetota bacterium]|nr:DUF697 domain-containing protein [Actinomycetota bacterium]
MSGDTAGSPAERAAGTVTRHMKLALAVGLVPVPLLDFAALAALQLRLVRELAKLYQVDFSAQLGQAAIGALVGGGASTAAAAGVRRLLGRLAGLPFILAGAASTAVFAGASTYAIGRVFMLHFDSGGTLLTFDPERVRGYYTQALAEGREQVERSFAGVRP